MIQEAAAVFNTLMGRLGHEKFIAQVLMLMLMLILMLMLMLAKMIIVLLLTTFAGAGDGKDIEIGNLDRI